MADTALRPARKALAQFAAVSFVFVAVLGWLGGRILEQDRALEIKRVQDRLERAADLIVASLDLGLTDALNRLSTLSDPGRTRWPYRSRRTVSKPGRRAV